MPFVKVEETGLKHLLLASTVVKVETKNSCSSSKLIYLSILELTVAIARCQQKSVSIG